MANGPWYSQDVEGNGALHVAVLTRQTNIIYLLLDAGADASLINFRLYCPFMESVILGQTQ